MAEQNKAALAAAHEARFNEGIRIRREVTGHGRAWNERLGPY